MKYHEKMDDECISLCNTINRIKGLETTESCCGHGKWPFRIYIKVNALESLNLLALSCSHCGWKIEVCGSESFNHPYFILEGPIMNDNFSEVLLWKICLDF